ncbi:S8 family serine peptidase [Nonomuraea sp. NPDC049504]|uniref:S8 family peptidase n=1 Tax=Nonomuraea sp. NPDC049504 TaxID=3154729 RepID=UPI0034223865
MRFRPLFVTSIALALLPLAGPAYADPTPAPTPGVTQPVTPPGTPPATQPPPEQQPAPEETPAPPQETPRTPEEKVEEGLGVDGGTERAIVELTDPAQHAPVATQAAAESVDVLLQPQDQSFMVVEGTAAELAKLAADPRVSSIHRDRLYSPAEVTPNLSLIGADQVHQGSNTGANQAVAVIDTGIDVDHPWFQGRILAQACFSATEDAGVESLCPSGATEQLDGDAASATTPKCLLGSVNMCDHGSHVAGIAAGTGGVAPGAGIVAVQVFSRINDEDLCGEAACLMAYESSLRRALEYVRDLNVARPIAAVNLSLGGWLYDTSCDTEPEGAVFKETIDALLAKNIATVVAAGNEYYEGVAHPACVSTAVAVGANDNEDRIADFSNRGPLLDLFAPGVDITSAVPDDATTAYSGTSMSTPHVAGALALMREANPGTPMTELIEKLKTTGRPYVYEAAGAQVSTPRLDLAAAITGATTQPPVSQSPAPEPPPGELEPNPTDSSGPTPQPEEPGDQPSTPPSPVPLPTVTVTVTVTQTATPAAPAAAVCTRGTAAHNGAKKLSAKKWAVELHRSSGKLSDETLTCYLKLIAKSSKVFPELTKASSLGKAYRVIKGTSSGKAKLDGALLTAWLNWAHGTNGTKALTAAEKVRLSSKPSAKALKKATTNILKTVK